MFGVLFALQFKALHRAPVTHLAWLAGRDTMPQLLSADSSGRVVLTTPATTTSPAVHTRLDQVAPLASLHKTHQVCTRFATIQDAVAPAAVAVLVAAVAAVEP